jgi:MtN3 and saliva related transmembrane protein
METAVSAIVAILTTAAFIPQAYKIIQSRETSGVSLGMHITFAAGVSFWYVLGVLLWNWPMMIANAGDLCPDPHNHRHEALSGLKELRSISYK